MYLGGRVEKKDAVTQSKCVEGWLQRTGTGCVGAAVS